MDTNYFIERKERAKAIFTAQKSIYNPYLKSQVVFNSDGFHHLQFSARRERDKKEQLLKFNLLPLAVEIIRCSGTLQEYRKGLTAAHKGKDGFSRMKETEYWSFVAIVGKARIKMRAVLRRVGDGNITFWSTMPDHKLNRQKLYTDGIDDE